MSNFKDRLIEEKQQVDERIKKLYDFISSQSFDGIPPVQQSLLKVQVQSMNAYGQCLAERLGWLEQEAV